jgi:predicted nucleotidyltransferase
MGKEEIKKRLLEAVKKDPHLSDIKSVAIFGSYVNGCERYGNRRQ